MGFALSTMQVSSSAFAAGGSIPRRHAADGDDVSPVLSWKDPPAEAKAFAVICHDPDAPLITPGRYGFVHWVLYDIPGTVHALAEGTTEYTAGKNDYGKIGYGGPLPPPGHGVHHYFFWVFALDRELALPPGLTMWELLERIEPSVLAMNRYVGTYERRG